MIYKIYTSVGFYFVAPSPPKIKLKFTSEVIEFCIMHEVNTY